MDAVITGGRVSMDADLADAVVLIAADSVAEIVASMEAVVSTAVVDSAAVPADSMAVAVDTAAVDPTVAVADTAADTGKTSKLNI
jgi:anti-sigma factor ChrR (cupin superfamily)